jgi:hypothetical protein
MRVFRTALLTLAALVALSVPALADTPNLIHYQGEISDSLGNPVTDGNYSVRFRIFDQSVGGVNLWNEITVQSTEGGLFNHLLGSLSPLPEDLFTAQDSLFMELVVEGETIAPRITLVSVGYARRVNTVDATLGGDITGAVTVEDTTSAPLSAAVRGILSNTSPGSSSAAVRGENLGTTSSGYGVWGSHDGTGSGTYGSSVDGRGVYGASTNGNAGYFKSFGGSPAALHVETSGAGDAAQFHDGDVTLFTAGGIETIELDPVEGSGGHIQLMKTDSTRTMTLDAGENGRSQASLYHWDGLVETVEILGTQVSDTTGGIISLRNTRNNVTVQIDGEEASTGGQIILATNDQVATIEIDGEFGSGGQGRMTINGSSDADLATPNSGYFMLGTPGGTNIIADDNEIMARNGSLGAQLHLQRETGQVVIGGLGAASLPAEYILLVDGKAILEEVEVQLSTVWPDYVFDDDYELMPLDKVEEHIDAKGHLPGMPSADDMENGTVPLGEMQLQLLEKVEELTLYVIGLKKELDEVKAERDALSDLVIGEAGAQQEATP